MAKRKKKFSQFTKPIPIIKWNESDEKRLKQAVSSFNKKVERLSKNKNIKNVLPDTYSYEELREGIRTRSELNRRLNSLARFMKKGASKVEYINETPILAWELNEARIEKSIAVRRYKEELEFLRSRQPQSKYYKKRSRASMGSRRVREIEGILKNIKKQPFMKLSGKALYEQIGRFHNIGTADFIARQNELFEQNYFKMYNKVFKGMPQSQKLRDVLRGKISANLFYKFLDNISEKYGDIKFMYFQKGQREFYIKYRNEILEEFGITEEEFMKESTKDLISKRR